jgi:hypothetical protein
MTTKKDHNVTKKSGSSVSKPCPIPECGCTDVAVVESVTDGQFVQCTKCGFMCSVDGWNKIPRVGGVVADVARQIRESLYKRRGIYSVAHEQEMSEWVDRLQQYTDDQPTPQPNTVLLDIVQEMEARLEEMEDPMFADWATRIRRFVESQPVPWNDRYRCYDRVGLPQGGTQ